MSSDDKKRPALRRPPGSANADAFIGGAKTETRAAGPYPWQASGVRSDVIVGFNLRLPEPLKLKLAWIAERTPQSQQQIVREAVEQAVEAKIRELTGGE